MAGSYDAIFRSIKTSTIWVEPPHVFKVWMLMLLSSDRAGIVEGSVPGLAAAAVVTVEQCREAIDRFLAPDPESRTKTHEGRRIEAIDGGWRILNYAKYQEKRDKSRQAHAEAQARYYRRAKADSTDASQHHTDNQSASDHYSDTSSDHSDLQISDLQISRSVNPKDLSGTPQPTSPRLDRPGQDSDARLPPQNRPEKRPQTSQATTPATPPPRPEAIAEQELKRRCREEPTRDLHSRAAQCVANPYDGLFERPETWPEVQAMAYAFSCVYGARYRHLGKIPQHKGLMTLLAILGAGVTHTDYMRAVNLSTEDDWFRKLKGPSLTTLSLDVVLRLLAEADERGSA